MDHTALAVVIPAGPADDIADTLTSVLHYTRAPRFVVVVDDGAPCDRSVLEAKSNDVHVIPAPSIPHNTLGGLWMVLATGYRYALENYHFDVLLRLDADALVINDGIAEAAAERFAGDAQVGMLGSYRIGPDGGIRDWTGPAKVLARECGLRGLDRPRMRHRLRKIRSEALAHGYIPGEHPLGGAYIHSRAAVLALAERGWLEPSSLYDSQLGEDQLVSLLTVAAGFRIGDFGGPDDPLALRWRGLPASPLDLLRRHKLVTHSVRFWEQMEEGDIRAVFARARQDQNHQVRQDRDGVQD